MFTGFFMAISRTTEHTQMIPVAAYDWSILKAVAGKIRATFDLDIDLLAYPWLQLNDV